MYVGYLFYILRKDLPYSTVVYGTMVPVCTSTVVFFPLHFNSDIRPNFKILRNHTKTLIMYGTVRRDNIHQNS